MTKIRLLFLAGFFVIGFGAVLFRAFQLQILPSEQVERLARRQLHQRIEIVGRRGVIRDRNGRELAVSTNSLSIFANPRLVKNPARVAAVLAPILRESTSVLEGRLAEKGSRRFVWLARQLDARQVTEIQALDLKTLVGVGTLREYRREYPLSPIASQTLGFVSVDGEGLEGVERRFDDRLQGDKAVFSLRRDALGRPLFAESDQIRLDQSHGAQIDLTLDSNLQFSAERALKEAVEFHEADSGSAIVMDPYSGEILALANYPGFDSEDPMDAPPAQRRNRAITDPIEPGSVLKPFVVARALDDRIVKPESRIDSGGGMIKIGRKTIHEAEASHAFKTISIVDLIRLSSNVGTVVLQQKMGFARVEDTFRKVGFGSLSGIEIEGESKGIFRSPRPEQKLEQATISFGQGIATTPLQIASAYSVIANGGLRVRPKLLKSMLDPEQGRSTPSLGPEEKPVRVFSEATAAKMRSILEKVVEGEGTGTAARIEGFRVGGKTGTAQRVNYSAGGYERGAYWSSFAGFVPADRPKFVIYVVIDRPRKNGYYGGVVAAPVFAKIARSALRLVPHESGESPPVVVGKVETRKATDPKPVVAVEAKKLRALLVGPAKKKQDSGDFGAVPDLSGMPLAQALRALKRAGLGMELVGEGTRVWSQLPEAGSKANADTTVILKVR